MGGWATLTFSALGQSISNGQTGSAPANNDIVVFRLDVSASFKDLRVGDRLARGDSHGGSDLRETQESHQDGLEAVVEGLHLFSCCGLLILSYRR